MTAIPLSVTFTMFYNTMYYHRNFYFADSRVEWCTVDEDKQLHTVTHEVAQLLELQYAQHVRAAYIHKQAQKN